MQLCDKGHENNDDSKSCNDCNFPFKVPDTDKITYLKKMTNGNIEFEMFDDKLSILDLTKITSLSTNISLLFPDLRNLKMKVDKKIQLNFLKNLKSLQYLTLNLKILANKGKLTNEVLESLPQNISSLTITVDENELDTASMNISKDLLKYIPNLKNLYIYGNPSNIEFLASGHNDLDAIEFMGDGFEFCGRIMNFPSLTSLNVNFSVTKIDLEMKNLPNMEEFKITLASTAHPVIINTSNADFDMELNFDL